MMCLILLAILCCQRETQPPASQAANDAPAIVSYPDQPAAPDQKLVFQESLRIHCEGWWPQGVLIDPEGRILISTYRENKLFVFDQAGRELEVIEFSKGVGPGEFSSMEPQIAANGDLHVYDRLQQRLSVIDMKDRTAKSIMRFIEMRWVFSRTPNEEFYFWTVRSHPDSRNIQDLVLSRYGGSGKLVKEYESYPYAPARFDKYGKRIYNLYNPYGIYKLDPAGNLYVVFSDQYEIRVYSPGGTLLRKLFQKIKRRGPEEKDLADILILSDASVLVVTFDLSEDPKTLNADWFSPEGRFLSQQKIPKYYLWFKAFGPGKSHAVFGGDHFYSIEPTNEAEDDFVVKQYTLRKSN